MQTEQALRFGPYRFDFEHRQLWRGTQAVNLRPKALAVLRQLVQQSGQVVSKEELFQTVWADTVVSEATLTFCIQELRRALRDDAKEPRYIETVHRRGFRFIAPLIKAPLQGLGVGDQGAVRELRNEVARQPEHAMSAPNPGPRTPSPVLVGRTAELTQLHGWLAKALQGERQLVFVTGEPGIGKTALIEVFLSGVRSREEFGVQNSEPRTLNTELPSTPKMWIGHGQCIEQHGAGEAFLPVLDALGRLARGTGGAQLTELLRTYAPMWLVQLPAFIDGEELETLQRKVQGASRERMLREFADMVEAFTTGGAHGGAPLLLVLEDLHWSDVSTLELLAFLARRKEPAHLLVIGTYRPVEILSEGQPLQSLTQELYAHRLATELPLGVLSEADIAAYLDTRLSGGARHAPQQPLARLLHQRTGGNPLFLVSTVEELVAQGILTQTDTAWTLQGEVADVGIAESIRHLVARQRGRLSPEKQHTLEAASIAGMEFSAAAVAAALTADTATVERRCEQLAEQQQFLRRVGVEAWPDGTLAARYSFLHAVYQQLWHERVSPTQLQHYHRHIGERKEHAYGESAREIATELALHFEQGRDYRKAVQYLQHAGQRASQRSANVEAISHFITGLKLLKTLPDFPERVQQELTLQIALGAVLRATKGSASPEAHRAYARSRELCEQMGDTPQLFPVLYGLHAAHITAAEHKTAHRLAGQMLRLAHRQHAPTFLLAAHVTFGEAAVYLGEPAVAREHLEQGIALYDSQMHHLQVSGSAEDLGVDCLSYAAWALWFLGYPDQARQRAQEALSLARGLAHPYSLAFALGATARFYQLCRDGQTAHELAEAAITLCTDQGFAFFLAVGTILRGWALAGQGQREEGIAQIRQGLASLRATGAELATPYYQALLAEAYWKMGQPEEGLAVLVEALARVYKTGERFYEAELYRLKGELMLAQSRVQSLGSSVQNPQSALLNPQAEAEACFLKAIDIARCQNAKSWELRTSTSLARLWQQQGKMKEVRQLLAEVYGWFTEGFDTKDLQEAKVLLKELA